MTVRGSDPELALAIAYAPATARAGLRALWTLDAALADVVRTGREPMIRRIKLAWWRDALEALDRRPAPAEPILEGLASDVLPQDVAGADVAALEQAWAVLLEPELGTAELDDYASRGALLFALSARLLGEPVFDLRAAGEMWALVDLARHSSREADAVAALAAARGRIGGVPAQWPVRLRPLGMLAMLAARDCTAGTLERQGSPARMLRIIVHRLTGR